MLIESKTTDCANKNILREKIVEIGYKKIVRESDSHRWQCISWLCLY